MHTGASYRRSRVITGPSHLGVYGPCVFIRCVIEKAKKTAQLGSKSSAFDGRVLLGLDRLGLNPVSQRHVTSGSCAGVWLIGCDPTDETDRCCSECGAAGRVRSSWRRRLYLVKSMFRVSSLIFLAVKNTAEPAQQTLKQYIFYLLRYCVFCTSHVRNVGIPPKFYLPGICLGGSQSAVAARFLGVVPYGVGLSLQIEVRKLVLNPEFEKVKGPWLFTSQRPFW